MTKGRSRAGRGAALSPSLAVHWSVQVSAWLASAGANPGGPLKLGIAGEGGRGRIGVYGEPGSDRGKQLWRSPLQSLDNARANGMPSQWSLSRGYRVASPLVSLALRSQLSPWVPPRQCVGVCRRRRMSPEPEPANRAAKEHEGTVHANDPAVAVFAGRATPRGREAAPLARLVP